MSSLPVVSNSNTDFAELLNRIKNHHMKVCFDKGLKYMYFYQPIPHQPLWLTDRHLSSKMAIQNIVCMPSIPDDIVQAFDLTWTRFLAENDVFPTQSNLPESLQRYILRGIDSPSSVFFAYSDQIAKHCMRSVSALHVLPKQPHWQTAFLMEERSRRTHLFLNEVNLYVSPDGDHPNDFDLPGHAAKALNASDIAKLVHLRKNRETLAVFNFIPPCPASDGIVSSSRLEQDCEWTISATESPITLPPFIPPSQLDVQQKWWSDYDSRLASTESHMRMAVKPTVLKRTVWVPPHPGTRAGEYQPDTSHFLQRMWCRAVENDATFMVLNTGNSERIGIRHRASNTLFLTPPLNPFEPPYMKYHMALYAAILDDAFSRLEAGDETKPADRDRKRRAADNDDDASNRASKRLKGESPREIHTLQKTDVEKELASRHVLLVSFDFGPFHSPAPSSFLRVSSSCHPDFVSKSFPKPRANRKYPLTKCLNFVAKEKVGRGATGTVYRGYVEIETVSGRVVQEDVVIKIPLGTKPSDRIHREYTVYEQLAQAGVTAGIVQVYGVFEDVETGSVAMMMNYAGTNLLRRELERTGKEILLSSFLQITLSHKEFQELLNIVKGINDADILHNDIKPDNIVIDSNGRLSIIDFDTTRPMYIPGDYKESPDIVTLRDMLAGKFQQDKRPYTLIRELTQYCNLH